MRLKKGLLTPIFLLSGALSVSACGSGAPEIPPELLPPSGGGAPAVEDYPDGPYGVNEGDTLRNLGFSGYFQPDIEKLLESVEFKDFYDPDGSKGSQLILINTAAAWCQPCRIEHSTLPERVDELGPQGLVVLSLLFQDSQGAPPTEETLSTWVDAFGSNFPMALDPTYQMGLYGPAETPPLNLVVDPRNMKMLRRFVGNQEGPMWTYIEAELDARNSQ